MPDPVQQDDAVTTPETPTTPTAATETQAVATTTSPTPTETSAQQPAVAASPQPPSWLNSLREKGVDLGVQDEGAAIEALGNLYKNYSQVAPLAPYVSAYVQNAQKFAQWQAEQQAASAKPATAETPWYGEMWNPPEYNPAWERLITQDAQGNLVPAPGAPADVIPKFLAYRQFRQEQAEKFMANPFEYMAPAIKKLAAEEAQRIVNGQFGDRDTKSSVSQFISQNSNWLYEVDANGVPLKQQVFNPMSGTYVESPKLSQWGQAFTRYVQQESEYQAKAGLPQDVNRQREVALALVQRDAAIAQMQQMLPKTPNQPAQAPVDPQVAANQQFLQSSNPPAALPTPNGNTHPAPRTVKRGNLIEEMLAEMKRNGVTSETLNN